MTHITKEEWLAWRNSKVTQEFLQRLYYNRVGRLEAIAEGQAETDKIMWVTVGQCQGLKDAIDCALFNFDVVDPSQEEANDSPSSI